MSAAENTAVFLSYASQDASAMRRPAEALRTAGIEVSFDQDELVGGDAWDRKNRRQIKECALFVPVISASILYRGSRRRAEWERELDATGETIRRFMKLDPRMALFRDDPEIAALLAEPVPAKNP